jgi:hypothetical protein
MPKKDLIGKVFNNWTVRGQIKDADGNLAGYTCSCSCGTEKVIKNISTVLSGKSASCGCLRKSLLKVNNPMFDEEVCAKVSKAIKSDPKRGDILARAVRAAQTPGAVARRIATNLSRYGGISPASSKKVKLKTLQTNTARYGGPAPASSSKTRDKMRLTNITKYGVDNIMRLEAYRQLVSKKVSEFYRNNNSIERLHNGLIAVDECRSAGIRATTYRNWRRELGAEAAQAKLYGEKLTYRSKLEKHAVQLLQPLVQRGAVVESWNKKAHEDMKYKPDIKVSYQDKTLFVDVDGLYWHSVDADGEDGLDKAYHFDKAAEFRERNLTLLQIREDELMSRGNIILSMVAHQLGMSDRKVGARTLSVVSVPPVTSEVFFSDNHLMGSIRGVLAFGLVDSKTNELLAVLAVRRKGNTLDISRFACKRGVSVSGGFSKLLSHVEKQHPDVSCITNFVDLRYATGTSSVKSGFSAAKVHLGFKWTDGKSTYDRRHCKADKSKNLSERQVAEIMGLSKIYDAGQTKFVKHLGRV